MTPDVLDAAIALKEELPTRSVRAILEILEQEELIAPGAVTRATLDRLLRRAGVMTRRPRPPVARGARRFQKAHRNQLWQADLKYGPYLPDPDDARKMRRTYLLAFIDDATRLVPYAAFFFAQREFQLEVAFKWAVLRYGLPDKLYVDNGKIFISEHFQLACARLNVRHARTAPYRPEAKGKIERFMGSTDRFLAELALSPAHTLEELNDTFAVWLDAGYNQASHDALDGRTPHDAFTADPQPLRPVDQQALHDAFLREETRKVDHTGCVKFRGTLCDIGARYAGKRITLRYAELPDGPHEVTAYDSARLIGPVTALAWNRPFAALDDPTWDPFDDPPATKPKRSRYLDALAQKGKQRRQVQGGIHFRTLGHDQTPGGLEGARHV